MTKPSQKKIFLKVVKSPGLVILGIICGALIGLYFKPLVPYLKPFEESYLALLTMSILPIMFFSVIFGIAKFMHSPKTGNKFLYLIVIFLVGILTTSIIGASTALFTHQSLHMSQNTEVKLGRLITATENYPSKEVIKTQESLAQITHLHHFIQQFIPHNIFDELTKDISIRLIMIALLMGMALGTIKTEQGKKAVNFLKLLNDIFEIIFQWIIYFLPLGLFCIFAVNISTINAEKFNIISTFFTTVCISSIVLFLIYNFILKWVMKENFLAPFLLFRRPLFLAFILDRDNVSIPPAIRTLTKLNVNRKVANLIYPLGIVMNRQGEVLLLVILSTFIAKFYNIHLGFYEISVIVLISAFSGAIISGRVIMLGSAFTLIANLIGMPIGQGLIILSIIDPFINRLVTVINVYANCASVALFANFTKDNKATEEV